MNIERKIELRMQQMEAAYVRLEKFKARGWDVMAAAAQTAILKLEREIDELEAQEMGIGYGDESPAEYRRMLASVGITL